LKSGIISLAAMLNKHQRGELWFGIKNDGTAVGQSISEASLREVSRAIGDHIDPKVYPTVEQAMVGEKPCIRVLVEGKDVKVGTALFVARFRRKEAGGNISETTGVPSEETSDKILAIIRLDMKTSARHMANILGLSSRAVEMQLAKLKQDGRLKRIGPKKGGRWEVRGD
jgi:predicted HTH transcriptional regulator